MNQNNEKHKNIEMVNSQPSQYFYSSSIGNCSHSAISERSKFKYPTEARACVKFLPDTYSTLPLLHTTINLNIYNPFSICCNQFTIIINYYNKQFCIGGMYFYMFTSD
ncbi:MAG: hypothetical protein [Caudoviricetes sp.]|nr:MAG: hypothetical protein [Caudoviricetes sp.]